MEEKKTNKNTNVLAFVYWYGEMLIADLDGYI